MRSLIKPLIGFAWCVAALVLFQSNFVSRSFSTNSKAVADEKAAPVRPPQQLVDRMDQALQLRFEKMPAFGIVRVQPINPPNPHLETFTATTPEEQAVVGDLETGHWQSAIYLFGRRAYEDPTAKNGERKLDIRYKVNNPVPVSSQLKVKELPSSEKLIPQIKLAFDAFLTQPSYEFSGGDWSYVARPVLARDGCIKCHGDMFLTGKLPNKLWSYRPRRAGDPIGILVYAFKPAK
jgi:hypothetical protein